MASHAPAGPLQSACRSTHKAAHAASSETIATVQPRVNNLGSSKARRFRRMVLFMFVEPDHDAAAHAEELAGLVGIVGFHRHTHSDAMPCEVPRQAGGEILESDSSHAGADGLDAAQPGLRTVQ